MNKFILLVEDNLDDVELTIRAFKRGNLLNEIVVANDGIEALECLSGTGKFEGRDKNYLPSLILLDLKMPRMGGLEMLKTIRSDERLKLIPTVILTSSKEEQDIMNSYSLGANSYIQKPVDFNQFMEATKQLGLYWMLLNETP